MRFLNPFLLVFLIGFSAWSAPDTEKAKALAERARLNSASFYDEVFDAEGKVRPQYQDVWKVYLEFQKEHLDKFRQTSLRDFQRDNALSALPKVMTREEYDELKKGVDQRARAALAFLEDHYSGRKSYLKEGVIPEDVMARVLERSGETHFPEHLKHLAGKLSFPYGSDLIRAANGKYFEIEFNSGFVGGFGDLRLARNILFERVPEYRKILGNTPDPEKFYKNMLERYRAQMKNPSELVAFISVPPYADHEDDRLNKLWREIGAHPIQAGDGQKLINAPDGLYVEVSAAKARSFGWIKAGDPAPGGVVRKKIGFTIVNGEHSFIDNTHPLTREKAWLETAEWALDNWGFTQARKDQVSALMKPDPKTGRVNVDKLIEALNPPDNIRNSGFPGLVDAIVSGKVASNYTPGPELLSDKELHTYMEDIIRHYLKEEPVIKNLPTERFYTVDAKGNRVLNQALLDDTIRNLDKYVVKVVDGRGGKGVWVGSKTSPKELEELKALIRKEPDRYIRQAFSHLSVADNDITDVRMLAQVGPLDSKGPKTVVSETPWARALPIDGNGKVNLSGDGHEMTVFVREEADYKKRVVLKDLRARECPFLFNSMLSTNY